MGVKLHSQTHHCVSHRTSPEQPEWGTQPLKQRPSLVLRTSQQCSSIGNCHPAAWPRVVLKGKPTAHTLKCDNTCSRAGEIQHGPLDPHPGAAPNGVQVLLRFF